MRKDLDAVVAFGEMDEMYVDDTTLVKPVLWKKASGGCILAAGHRWRSGSIAYKQAKTHWVDLF